MSALISPMFMPLASFLMDGRLWPRYSIIFAITDCYLSFSKDLIAKFVFQGHLSHSEYSLPHGVFGPFY